MKFSPTNCTFAFFVCLTLLSSCRKDVSIEPNTRSTDQAASAAIQPPTSSKWKSLVATLKRKNALIVKTDGFYKSRFEKLNDVVKPSECSATALDGVIQGYFNQFEFWDYILFPDYIAINQFASVIDRSKQYFGRNGEYTHLVTKQQRKLEGFWNITNIRINGQHSETLGNRDKIADAFMIYGNANREDAYYIADQIISMNLDSKVFPESPLLSFDGFATNGNLIVIGDGLIEALTSSGVVDDIVVAGLLSHEWSHQVQFANFKKWYNYSSDDRPATPEFTRQLELEADFLSSYFLTHKRGATYNWKRVAEFNQLFFNMGDCEFTNSGHHGTPQQRLNASKFGYSVANETRPMGHILTADQLHSMFIKKLPSLL